MVESRNEDRRPGREIPAELRRDVGLLGGMLGQVLRESEGPGLFEDVERLRRATIALRTDPSEERREAATAIVESLAPDRAGAVARAFAVYFHLVNLAEERHRVRTLRDRGREEGLVEDSIVAAVREVREGEGEAALAEQLAALRVTSVLTAHPTEARRRAVVETLRRIARLLERLDEPRGTRPEEAETRRRLMEEITVLWRTDLLRPQRPTPLDEVRATMSLFDETLFLVAPVVYRRLEQALAGDEAGRRPPGFPAFLRWGSWVGSDRDGNPSVTADVTRRAADIQAEHVLRGLEAASRQIARSLPVSERTTPPTPELVARLERDERAFEEAAEAARRRAPDQPHRRSLSLMAERLVATRTGAPGGYPGPDAFLDDLRALQRSLAEAGAERAAYGQLQDLIWQVETFGFHVASLEVRQHASVHAAVVEQLAPAADAQELDRLATEGWPEGTMPRSDAGEEVLATLRAMRDVQARHGPASCRRYVVSFTRGPEDVAAVHALARLAVPDGSLELDVVPLFESSTHLAAAPRILDALLELPGIGRRLQASGRELEVMLGYSDTAKEIGYLAANVLLYRAQAALAAWARGQGVALTLFHGRGGALGRGGGPTNRAILSQAPGSVAGRFKVTDQGEVVFARYGHREIARRHLEQVTNAVLRASSPSVERAAEEGEARHLAAAERMAEASEKVYRDLVERPGFADFFARVTPVEKIEELRIGSRPARRDDRSRDLGSLRAIPWVFAWAQSRVNLPGWYALGTGLAAVAEERGGGKKLRAMYREWPFFRSLLANAELSLAETDPTIAHLYLELAGEPAMTEAIETERRRTEELVLAASGHDRVLDGEPLLQRAVELRNPYVDALSLLQLRFLRELRDGGTDEEATAGAERIVQVTVKGVAAGLQNTG